MHSTFTSENRGGGGGQIGIPGDHPVTTLKIAKIYNVIHSHNRDLKLMLSFLQY